MTVLFREKGVILLSLCSHFCSDPDLMANMRFFYVGGKNNSGCFRSVRFTACLKKNIECLCVYIGVIFSFNASSERFIRLQ